MNSLDHRWPEILKEIMFISFRLFQTNGLLVEKAFCEIMILFVAQAIRLNHKLIFLCRLYSSLEKNKIIFVANSLIRPFKATHPHCHAYAFVTWCWIWCFAPIVPIQDRISVNISYSCFCRFIGNFFKPKPNGGMLQGDFKTTLILYASQPIRVALSISN